MKRILCIALTLLLGLTLLAPAAFAAEETETPAVLETSDAEKPIFTAQAKTSDGAMFAGRTLDLSVEAVLPEGSTNRLVIDWYNGDWNLGDETQPIATGANATIDVLIPEENLYWIDAPSQNLNLYAVAKSIDAEGNVVAYAKSGPVNVIVVQPIYKTMEDMWGGFDQGEGFWYGLGQLLWIRWLAVPVLVLTFLPGYLALWILTLVK